MKSFVKLFVYPIVALIGFVACGTSTRPAVESGPSLSSNTNGSSFIRITGQPELKARNATGTDIIVSIEVDSSGPVNYQWFKDDREIAGATDSQFAILNGAIADTGQYYVRIALVDPSEPVAVNSIKAAVEFVEPIVSPLEGQAYNPIGIGVIVNPRGAFTVGQVAGLAHPGGGSFLLDGQSNTACAFYNFAQVLQGGIANLEYRHTDQPVGGDVCSVALDRCQSSPGIQLYTSLNGIAWQNVATPAATPQYVTHQVPVNTTFAYLMVCRGGGGGGFDNIQLRNISVTRNL